ncbi:MAG TPA: PIG-L deacetylase family protein [Terriglobia bacterium]|nr:PIG-L deacetylase family protein [Terriglobia bacterium]
MRRREVLARTSKAAAAVAIGIPPAETAESGALTADESVHKLKVIVAGGHPGDPEYGCGGTVARYASLGHEVVLLYLNNGEWPASKGGAPASTRMAEASKACGILKARPVYAGQINGQAVLDAPHFNDFRRILETERPDVVLTQWPIDAHRDHRATWALGFDAWLQMGKKFALYYYEVSDGEDTLQFSPTHYVDITAVEPTKRAACYAHASQTPDRYYALQDQVATFRGIEGGFERAEAFILQPRSPYQPLPGSS